MEGLQLAIQKGLQLAMELTELFLYIFQNFQNTFTKLCYEFVFSSVAACRLVSLQLRVKGNFLEFLEELNFET